MNKIYQRIDWENYPSSATPLNEDNLNKMDYAIDKLDDRIVTHETTKLNTATGNTLVKNVTFNEKTGVFTFEKLSGSKITINTALEKISTNFHFNPTTQKLVLTLIDGTVQEIDLSALITQYEFLESDTITFEIDANGKVKANILNGSITGEKLEPNYLANVTLQANNAKTSADNAKTSEELAYQYAEEAKESASQTAKSDAKNITYDNTESGLSATNVKDALDEVAQGSVSAIAIETTITDSTNAPLIYGKFKGYTEQQTYSGKNLCNVGSTSDVIRVKIPIEHLANGETYTLSCVITSTDTDNNRCALYIGSSFTNHLARDVRVSQKFVKSADTITIYASLDYNSSVNDTVTVTDVQIEKGDTATTYEPYVGGITSPNPDYPQEINGLAKDGAIEVKTCEKNLQYNSATYEGWITEDTTISNVVTNELYNGGKVLKYTKPWQYAYPPAILYKKGTYTISFDAKATTNGYAYLNELTNAFLAISGDSFKRYSHTFTITEDTNSFITPLLPIDTTISELYIANIQVEMNTTATPYQPYTETTATIPTDAPLYEGDYLEMYADGSGKVVKKMGSVVFDGSSDEEWNKSSEGTIYYTILNDAKYSGSDYNVNNVRGLCSHFTMLDSYSNAIIKGYGYCGFGVVSSLSKTMIGMNSSLTTVNEWKSWLQSNPVTVVYELAKPIETPLTAEQVAQFKKLYTFEPVTNVLCDGEVEIQYYKNTDSGETVAMVSKKADNSVSKSNSLENRLSKSLVSTETINIDSLSLSSGGLSTITSEEISKSGYTLVGAKFFLRGGYAENIITSFSIGGSSTKIYNFVFYNPSDYNISAYGYVDLIYVANSL